MLRSRFAAILIGTILTSASAAAQEPERYAETVDVSLVNVELVVTDAAGRTVGDLARGEIRVLDDGEPVEITHFSTLEEVAALAPRPLVLFLDDADLMPSRRRGLYETLLPQLDGFLAAGGEILVARFTRRLDVEQGFSASRDDLAATLERLASLPPAGAPPPGLRERQLLQEIRGAEKPAEVSVDLDAMETGDREALMKQLRTEAESRSLMASIRLIAAWERDQTARRIAALRGFVAALATVEGPKSMLLVSPGFDLRPGDLLVQAWYDNFGETAASAGSLEPRTLGYDLTAELDRLIAEAQGGHLAVYTLGLSSGQEAGGEAGVTVAAVAPERERELSWLAPLRRIARPPAEFLSFGSASSGKASAR